MNEGVRSDHTVSIHVDDEGFFTYTNDPGGEVSHSLHVRRGESVTWSSGGVYPFAIDFGKCSPLEAVPRGNPEGEPITGVVSITAPVEERYKYTVAVYHTGVKRVFMDDPTLIVDP